MKKSSAFTLLEILIVIVIIGILTIIAVPIFINMRNDAINAAAQANISALRSALSAYYSNSAVHNELCGPPYITPAVNAPCYPPTTTALESLLATPTFWADNGGGQCYNSVTNTLGGC